jgi:Transcriptional regulator
MNLLHLRYFRTLAKTEKMSQAAQTLHIAPPSLSLTISRLEKELGVSLFDRVGNRIKLNENGKEFYSCVDEIFIKLDNTIEKLSENANQKKKFLSVATTSPNMWCPMFEQFTNKYPDISIKQNVVRLANLNVSDLETKYDFIMTSPTDLDYKNLNMETIYDDDYPVLLVNKNSHLAKKNSVKFSEVKDERFIALSDGFSSRKLFDDFCLLAKVKPTIVLECDYIMRARMIQNNVGVVAMATARVRMDKEYANIRVLNITEPKYTRTQALFWSKKRNLSKASCYFKNFVKEFFEKNPIK